jgi:hypothetical protein
MLRRASERAPIPMTRRPSTWRRRAVFAGLLALAIGVPSLGRWTHAQESRAHVRLVRLLEEVPDSDRKAFGNVHDLRLRLERGNILLLRRGGISAAMLPIEEFSGSKDSLRYFYYYEHAPFLWVFPGQKDRGIGTVADGESITIDAFDLRWRAREGALGFIYFPEGLSSRNVRFSVVSGRTVDEADPMDTKYWIELGPAEDSGF